MPIRILVTLGILAALAGGADAATYWVDDLETNCNPASPGAGTQSDPWKNLNYAIKRLQCGDTLNVRQGTYRVDAAGYANGACSTVNGEYSVAYFTQKCPSTNKIVVQSYNGETVILDGTSSQIDDANPASHWRRCESASQCGACTGLALKDYTRTYYSEPYNHSNARTQRCGSIRSATTPTTPGATPGIPGRACAGSAPTTQAAPT
jgi:hypothetical protein